MVYRSVPLERESRVFRQAAAPAETPVFAGHNELCVFQAGRGTDGVLERHIGQRPDGGEGEDRAFFRAQGAGRCLLSSAGGCDLGPGRRLSGGWNDGTGPAAGTRCYIFCGGIPGAVERQGLDAGRGSGTAISLEPSVLLAAVLRHPAVSRGDPADGRVRDRLGVGAVNKNPEQSEYSLCSVELAKYKTRLFCLDQAALFVKCNAIA